MSETIDLRVRDPRVWEYVCKLQHADAVGRILEIRCATCNTKLGEAANTPHGPGFAAWWRDWQPDVHSVSVNGRQLSPRETRRYLVNSAEEVEGDWGKEPQGYFAPLAIPPKIAQEYVPLLVRCVAHGDTILNRLEVLAALRRDWSSVAVRVERCRFDVSPQQVDDLKRGETKHARLVRRIGGESWTPDSLDAFFAEMEGDTPRQ